MKKIIGLLSLAFLVIAACMIYLVYTGVSLRSAPIVKPSPIDAGLNNISDALNIRLSPDFLESDYVLWGVLPETPEIKKIREQTQKMFENINNEKVTWIGIDEDLQECPKPCWVLAKRDEAHELSPNPIVEEVFGPTGARHFGISFLYFERELDVPQSCLRQKRIEYPCMAPLAVQEVRRKMKDDAGRLFFVRKYNNNDYFVFIEKP